MRVALARARVLDAAGRGARCDHRARRPWRATALLLTADEQTERDGLLARRSSRLGNADSAVAAGRRAVAGVERIRGQMSTGELRAGYIADRATIYADLVLALLRRGEVEEAFRVADAARGRALTERLGAETRSLSAASRRDVAELRELLARIELLTARLRATDSARTRERGRSGTFARDGADEPARRRGESSRRCASRVAREEPGAAIIGASTVDMREVQRSLAPNEALWSSSRSAIGS